MKPREPAIGMAERAQGGCDPRDCRDKRLGRVPIRFAQRLCRPCEKREHIEKFFGIAGWDAALGINLSPAILFERGNGLLDRTGHPFKRKARIDHSRQRFEPREAGARRFPAAREKQCLAGERKKEPVGRLAILAAQDQKAVVDPADQAAAG